MFPAAKRATAIGVCNFIARALTICAPLVAELKRPVPAVYVCFIALTALLVATTFPTKEEELALLELYESGAPADAAGVPQDDEEDAKAQLLASQKKQL